MSTIQPSLRERICRFFRTICAPAAEAKVADLSTFEIIKEAMSNFDLSMIERLVPNLSIDARTMSTSMVPVDDIVLIKPINEREFSFKIDAKLDISALHEHLGTLASHHLRLVGTILENRKIAWNYATLL